LFNKQYASQAKMKKVQPKLKKIQALYKDDRVKLQQEMMGLYKKEGVNPMAGCLPIIPTIFIFFALYKSVFINVDMRHAPFFGWIKDLSAPDPLSILNGFGALPWGAEPFGLSFLAIGPLALLYGITMAMMQTLSPIPGGGAPAAPSTDGAPDPMAMQAKIFKYMPWFFMFILAPFATGLLVYWVWNNILSFTQQYIITRKFKVETPIDKFFRKITGKPEPEDVV
jgi:YidC/Oxa1 family membrane protein insertase